MVPGYDAPVRPSASTFDAIRSPLRPGWWASVLERAEFVWWFRSAAAARREGLN
jgi:hypothetical protein